MKFLVICQANFPTFYPIKSVNVCKLHIYTSCFKLPMHFRYYKPLPVKITEVAENQSKKNFRVPPGLSVFSLALPPPPLQDFDFKIFPLF